MSIVCHIKPHWHPSKFFFSRGLSAASSLPYCDPGGPLLSKTDMLGNTTLSHHHRLLRNNRLTVAHNRHPSDTLITSRIDYCHAVLHGVSIRITTSCLQNGKLIERSDVMTPVLRSPHAPNQASWKTGFAALHLAVETTKWIPLFGLIHSKSYFFHLWLLTAIFKQFEWNLTAHSSWTIGIISVVCLFG